MCRVSARPAASPMTCVVVRTAGRRCALAQGHDVLHTQPCGVGGFVVRLLLAQALGIDPGQVVLDFTLALRIAPAENVSHEFSDYRGGGHTPVPRFDRDPGAAGQDVLDMAGT